MTKMTSEPIHKIESNDLDTFQQAALDKAEKDLETLKAELQTKKYLIDLSKDDIVVLDKFNKVDAPWKFTESLGIIEVEKDLAEAQKSGKLFIGAITIEAIYYYLSKVEGKGKTTTATAFKTVSDYVRVLKAISNGKERVKVDNESLTTAEFIVASRREGIDPNEPGNPNEPIQPE